MKTFHMFSNENDEIKAWQIFKDTRLIFCIFCLFSFATETFGFMYLYR